MNNGKHQKNKSLWEDVHAALYLRTCTALGITFLNFLGQERLIHAPC